MLSSPKDTKIAPGLVILGLLLLASIYFEQYSKRLSKRPGGFWGPGKFLSINQTLYVLLYSLLFFGTVVPEIAGICVVSIIPFSGGAWIAGVYAASFFKTNTAYLPAAWFAVFLQAYLLATIAKIASRNGKSKTEQ